MKTKTKRKKYLVSMLKRENGCFGRDSFFPLAIYDRMKDADSFATEMEESSGSYTEFKVTPMTPNQWREEVEGGKSIYDVRLSARYKALSCEVGYIDYLPYTDDIGKCIAHTSNSDPEKYYTVRLWAKNTTEATKQARKIAMASRSKK